MICHEDSRTFTEADLGFYHVLGQYLRYGDLELTPEEYVRAAGRGRGWGAKLWLKALRQVDRRQKAALAKSFDEMAARFRRDEYRSGRAWSSFDLLMREPAILWHLTDRKGIAPAWDALPVEASDHLMIGPTIRGGR